MAKAKKKAPEKKPHKKTGAAQQMPKKAAKATTSKPAAKPLTKDVKVAGKGEGKPSSKNAKVEKRRLDPMEMDETLEMDESLDSLPDEDVDRALEAEAEIEAEAEEEDEDIDSDDEDDDEDEDEDGETLNAGDENDEDVILTDAEGNRYCRVRDCDQIQTVDGYCRFHYLLLWKKIQVRKKILTDGKLQFYIVELTSRYPDKFLEMIRRDLRTQKDFLSAIQELEIDESGLDNDYEEEDTQFIDEVRGMGEGAADSVEDDF